MTVAGSSFDQIAKEWAAKTFNIDKDIKNVYFSTDSSECGCCGVTVRLDVFVSFVDGTFESFDKNLDIDSLLKEMVEW